MESPLLDVHFNYLSVIGGCRQQRRTSADSGSISLYHSGADYTGILQLRSFFEKLIKFTSYALEAMLHTMWRPNETLLK